jgi:hypothetical protein
VNPFDLRGPAFLAFYALVSTGRLIYMWLAARGVVFGALAVPQRLHQVRDDSQLKNVVEAYVQPPRQTGLIADDGEFRRRLPAFVLRSRNVVSEARRTIKIKQDF